MCFGCGAGQVTTHLIGELHVPIPGKTLRIRIAGLFVQTGIVQAAQVDPGRGSCFEAGQLETQLDQRHGKSFGRGFTAASAGQGDSAYVNEPAQKGAGGQDHLRRLILGADQGPHSPHPVPFHQDLRDVGLDQQQVCLRLHVFAHEQGIELAVVLAAGCPDGRPLAAVEHAEVYPREVRHISQLAAQGVYLPGQMAFGGSAERGITAHAGQGFQLEKKEGGVGAASGGGEGCLDPGVASAHHDHVKAGGHGISSDAGQTRRRADPARCF